jgi:hypothetical protein
MDALNLWTQQQKQIITATNNNMEDEQNILHQVVWKQYKQLYYDSIVTFREQLGEQQPMESSSALQDAMTKLEDVGFSDPKWAKRYRQVRGYRLRQDLLTRHLEKQTVELLKLEGLLAKERLRFADLEEMKRLNPSSKDSSRKDDASKTTSKKEEEAPKMEESSPSLFSTVWSAVSSVFSPTSMTETASIAIKEENERTTSLEEQTAEKGPSRLEKRIMRKHLVIVDLQETVDAARQKLKKLQADIPKERPPMSEDEYDRAYEVVSLVRDDICKELAQHIQQRHAQLIQQYQTLDSKTGMYTL